ncbi:cation-translocating P-type ATPase [Microbacterium yannicii]|uniref:cation-translocating P-type ATPase n=1 Tax=Microbacterium yannicii TaxID=671622 RepID=UPI0006862F40|nr:HAD-IC family P-type ATPase [Microbacterium yannicii]
MDHRARPFVVEAEAAHALSGEQVLEQLGSTAGGLSEDEAAVRLEREGPNLLPEPHPRHPLLRLLGHFNNILIYILLASAVVKAVYRDWLDFWVILVVAVATAAIGFVQEGQAERALAGIQRMLSVRAAALRDEGWRDVPAETLVPGDIVRLRPGDRVPADLRLLAAENLEIEESALTGESAARSKDTSAVPADAVVGDRDGMAFSGTIVHSGTGTGVVVATGSATEIGRIQNLITEIDPLGTPLTRQLDILGKRIALLILVLAAVMTIVGLVLHGNSPEELLDSAITFAVAAVPEGLPAIVTITLALGVQQMARRHAIARRLTAVETLGEVTTICSDKTGTLTYNEMAVRRVQTRSALYRVEGEGYRPVGRIIDERTGLPGGTADDMLAVVAAMARCNDSALVESQGEWSIVGTPTEASLLVLARKSGFEDAGGVRIATLPFASANKFMAVVDRNPAGAATLIAKGAPDRLLARCQTERGPNGDLRPVDLDHWNRIIDGLAAEGYRILAAATRPAPEVRDSISEPDVNRLTFLGVVGIADPPRREVITAIAQCRDAGIRVTMITGDHAATAATISRELGIPQAETPRVVTGAELQRLSDAELAAVAPGVDVFARTSPEHKIRIVRALQERGQVVAMTGDGVNDAPALTRADVGIAMGITGTEATKGAADIVLADDNFATIERAVAEGRRIFDNIQKSLMFILPTTFAQALIVLTAVLVGFAPPLEPTQVLWVNLVTAVTLSLALAYEPAETGVMSRPPRHPEASIIDVVLLPRVVWATLLITAATIGIYFAEAAAGATLDAARTSAVTMLVLGQVAYLFNSRFLRSSSLTVRALRGNPALWWSVGVLVALQLLFIYAPPMQTLFHTAPLAGREWGIAMALALTIFLLLEAEKLLVTRVEARLRR